MSFYASCPNYATRFLALSSGIRYRYRIAKSHVRSPGTRIHRNTGIVWLMSAAVSCCLRETATTLQSLNGTRVRRPRPERRAHANRGNCGCFCRRVRGANPGTPASAGPARAERGLAGGPDRTGIAGRAVRIVASARRRPGAEHHDRAAGDSWTLLLYAVHGRGEFRATAPDARRVDRPDPRLCRDAPGTDRLRRGGTLRSLARG